MSAQSHRPASLVRNTVAQSGGRLTAYVLSFVSAPIVLHGLGLRNFGIWAVSGALAQYAGLLDLGVGFSLARYIARNPDDRKLCGQVMAIGWLSVLVIGLITLALAVLGAAAISHALGGISAPDMRVVLAASVVLLCSSMLTGVIAALALGRRRMVRPNLAFGVGALINFAASVGSIALGAGLPGYAVANAAAGLVTVAVVAVLVFHAEGKPPLAWPRGELARGFLGFSVRTQLVRVSNLVNFQTDKIVIAFFIGPAAAGAYEISNRLAIAVREAGIYVTSALDVELTAVATASGLAAVRARYRRLNEVTATLSFPPVLLVMSTAPLLLGAWLGHAPPRSVPILVALCASYLVAVSTGVSYSVAVAAGEPGVLARAAVGTALANIVLTVALAPAFGLWGVLAGTVLALSAGSCAQVVLVHRRYRLPLDSYLGAVAPAFQVYLLLSVPIALVSYMELVHGRAGKAVLFAVLASAYAIACFSWAVKAGRLPGNVLARLPRMAWLRPSL